MWLRVSLPPVLRRKAKRQEGDNCPVPPFLETLSRCSGTYSSISFCFVCLFVCVCLERGDRQEDVLLSSLATGLSDFHSHFRKMVTVQSLPLWHSSPQMLHCPYAGLLGWPSERFPPLSSSPSSSPIFSLFATGTTSQPAAEVELEHPIGYGSFGVVW